MESYAERDGRGAALITAGSDIAGSLAGAAVGLLFGGPEAAYAGAAIGPLAATTLSWGVTETADRVLSGRERARAGAAATFAVERLKQRLTAGGAVREDGFFQTEPSGRNAGREIVEGVLLAARRSFEERKVRHLGYLFTNVALDAGLDAALVSQSLVRAEALTWRQYVLLAAVGPNEAEPLADVEAATHTDDWQSWGARAELLELSTTGLVGATTATPLASVRVPSTKMQALRLTTGGFLLHELLALDLISEGERRQVRAQFDSQRCAASAVTGR